MPGGSNDTCARPPKKWEEISVPFLVKPAHDNSKGLRCLWFKGQFHVTGDPGKIYGISPGRVYFSDEIYINGTLVNSQSLDEVSNIHEPRNYFIQKGIVRKGINTAVIKVGIPGDRVGGLADPVIVSDKETFKKYRLKYELLYKQIPLAIIVFLAAGIIPLLVYFAYHPREYVFPAGAMVTLLQILYIASFFSPLRIWDLETTVIIQLAHIPLFAMAMIMLIQAMYRVYLHRFNLIAFCLLAVAAVISFMANIIFPAMIHKILFGMLVLFVASTIYTICLIRIHAVRPDRYRLVILVLFIVLIQAIIFFELTTFVTGWYPSGIVATYCIPIFNLLFSIMAGVDIGKRFKDMQANHERLRLALSGKTRGISESTRDKLDSIIDYLNNNYREDISREGLAGAVDMNHDYMSRQFKAYTGKKINDYINERRVNDAIAMIEERDASILQIALAVGFESLSTFNRAFKKATGKRPVDFVKNSPR